jgi:tRNA(adenine34) deaminase
MWSRRVFSSSLGVLIGGRAVSVSIALAKSIDLSTTPIAVHAEAMRLAIAAARGNPAWPFGAVIVRADDRKVMANGVNNSVSNPTFHGEIVAVNDYVARHGNQGWEELILYTTAEPCPMCMSALVWARVGGVVYGTSIHGLEQYGIDQIEIPAKTVIAAAPFYRGAILGGVLRSETDALFRDRKHP